MIPMYLEIVGHDSDILHSLTSLIVVFYGEYN